jgi:hypothetical protein
MVETLWDKITQFVSPEAGQRRRAALDEFGRDIGYYVPPEMRGILGMVAESTPTASIDRASQSAVRMVQPGRTAGQRIGDLGGLLSETAGVVAPAMVAPRAGLTAAQAAQEMFMMPVAGADDAARMFMADEAGALNFRGQSKLPTQDVFGSAPSQPDRSIRTQADALIESGDFDKLPSQRVSVSQITPTQRFLGRENMGRVAGTGEDTGAFLLKQGDQYFVLDGHHRIAENISEGRDFVNARVFEVPPSLPAPRNEAEAMARQVLEMRAAGRAGDVTEEMRAAADPQYMFANTPLPMDETSRMARAGQMFPDTAYHATGVDFQEFVPSEFRGASFFAATPEGAQRGASASANEGVGSGSSIMMPVRVDTRNVEGLGAYGRKDQNEFAASLPNRIYSEAEVDALMASDAAPLYGNWSYFFDDLTDYDALRKFRDANPDAPIPEGIIKYRPKQPLPYAPGLRSDISGRQFAHYSEGMSERPISEYTKEIGNTGFTMMDESGLALAMTDPTKIRSRFALFDPEFAHLRNLSAGVGGLGLLGLGAYDAQQGEQY